MKPLRLAMLTLTLLPLVSLAGPPGASGGEGERTERMEKRTRMMRVLGLVEDLELNEAQAVKMADTLRQFDERRRPLLLQVREAARVLRKAAQGDTTAHAQVDQAVQQVFDARTQLTALDREMYQALSRELPPQKRAQLAIFLARHEAKMNGALKKADRDGRREQRLRERRHQRP